MKLLLIQGANMEYLGHRQPELYGTTTAAELDAMLQAEAHVAGSSSTSATPTSKAKRSAGAMRRSAPASTACYSIQRLSLRRLCAARLPALIMPAIEIHMTNIEKRAMHSVTAEAAVGMVMGFGIDSYFVALEAMVRLLTKTPALELDLEQPTPGLERRRCPRRWPRVTPTV